MPATDLDKVEVHGQRDGYATKNSRTATKTDTPLLDVPQSVTVVSQQQIKDLAIQGMADAVRYVPGIGITQGEGNRDGLVFRGNSSTADLFIDGMRDDVQYFRDVYNIDRIEAFKGPNAMIFGRGSPGGLLNRVSKVADWNTVRQIGLQVGSWDKRRLTADVNQSINETLSRTILTSATVFFVTLAMNIFGTGVIRDFAFAMNVGVIVGTYSSIFIASPILIWLNDKYLAAQKNHAGRAARAARRSEREERSVREDAEPLESDA
jgi:outer membrane receptor for Fe3+-dicitrate